MSNVRLNLEFAPKASRSSISGLVFLTTAIVLFSIVAIYAARTSYENFARQHDLAALESAHSAVPRAPVPRPLRADPAELARVQFVRLTSRNLTAPWADLLVVLEKAPSNVALLAVEPSAAKRSVALTAEAAGPADMIKYLQALQSDPHLANVVLVSHQVQLQTPGTPMRFQLRASWGDAP